MAETRHLDENYWRHFVESTCAAWELTCDVQVAEPFGTGFPEHSILIKVTYSGSEETFDGSRWAELCGAIDSHISEHDFEIDLAHTKMEWTLNTRWKQWVIFPLTFRPRH